jgi:hypothetical protein
MYKQLSFITLLVIALLTIAQQPPKSLEKYNSKSTSDPCVQVYLNGDPVSCGDLLSQKAKGIITVSKDNVNKIFFNITIKSTCGKNEPPVYLRFIKLKQMDMADLMDYVENGDEIFVEEYVPALNKIDLNCSPANFTVSNPS